MSSDLKKIYIHVGLPKTGSTFLRNNFFAELNNVALFTAVKKNDSNPISGMMFELGQLQMKYGRKIEEAEFPDPEYYKKKINQYFQSIADENILISWSSFLCSMGGARDDFKSIIPVSNFLKRVFSEARIIMIIRRQDTYIESNYSQVLKKSSYAGDFDSFVRINCLNDNDQRELFINPSLCNYLHFYNTYCTHFGRNNILIIPFEKLVYDQKNFIEDIVQFMQVKSVAIDKPPENLGYSGQSMKLSRIYNKFRKYSKHKAERILDKPIQKYLDTKSTTIKVKFIQIVIGKLKQFQIRAYLEKWDKFLKKLGLYSKPSLLTKTLRDKIMNTCSASNKELSDKLHLQLTKYGYY